MELEPIYSTAEEYLFSSCKAANRGIDDFYNSESSHHGLTRKHSLDANNSGKIDS